MKISDVFCFHFFEGIVEKISLDSVDMLINCIYVNQYEETFSVRGAFFKHSGLKIEIKQ